MKTSFKVFLACAFGSITGLIVALSISDSSFLACIIGMVIGGLFGYLAYDFKQVISAIKVAWRQVINFKPDKEAWRGRVIYILLICSVLASVIIGLWLIVATALMIAGILANKIPFATILEFTKELFAITGIYIIIAMPLLMALMQRIYGKEIFKGKEMHEEEKRWLKKYNPFRIYILSFPKLFTKWIPKAASKVAKFFSIIFKLFWSVLKAIHSDQRLICMSYAASGVLIGYTFPGSGFFKLIIGGVVGGATGFGAFELLFKKKPETANQQKA